MTKATNTQQHLYDLLKDFDTAMLVTQSADGHMHSRPMAIAELRAGFGCVLRHQHRFAEGRRDQGQPQCDVDISKLESIRVAKRSRHDCARPGVD